jgi:hypothetical protein
MIETVAPDITVRLLASNSVNLVVQELGYRTHDTRWDQISSWFHNNRQLYSFIAVAGYNTYQRL